MYPINEIFYSLQGEGYWAGRPTVFIRFSGCNLHCSFCDTDHKAFHPMTLDELLTKVNKYPTTFVVLTGGEPSLYVDKALVEALHSQGKNIAIETNGTKPVAENIDWITLSPKDSFVDNAKVVINQCHEVKIVFDGNNQTTIETYSQFPAQHYYLQPCDTGDPITTKAITTEAIQYCLSHPQWSLSLQLHKIIGIQ